MHQQQRFGSVVGSVVVAVVAVALVGGPASGLAWAGDEPRIVDPHPKTIVKVTGDAANGFGIHYLDGTADFPPTDSEARAECGEYDTRVERVRCRTRVRTWYAALGDAQASIRYYKALLREARE